MNNQFRAAAVAVLKLPYLLPSSMVGIGVEGTYIPYLTNKYRTYGVRWREGRRYLLQVLIP